MSTFRELGSLTRNQALSLITRELGFPNPSPQYLQWYFTCDDGVHYVPKVDFETLGSVIAEKGLVKKLGNVIHLPKNDQKRFAVIAEIRNVINEHPLEESSTG